MLTTVFKMKNDKFYEKLMDWQPDVVLTLGNPMFMKHVYRRIAGILRVSTSE